ncbi:MAG: phosphatidylglycerophosphatase A family protein, partial [Candidatus Acidiferrales bacterium]
MNPRTDPPPSGQGPGASSAAMPPAPQQKPRIAIFIATAGGLGRLPKAPGTWGSLLGVAFAAFNFWQSGWTLRLAPPPANGSWQDPLPHANYFLWQLLIAIVVSLFGVWAAQRAADYWREKDPQKIVIDEVSGQSIAYLGLLTAGPVAGYWKYLLLGFILFRVFDIWKPFPVRQAESLPGGWGIMADDWLAGIYAAL